MFAQILCLSCKNTYLSDVRKDLFFFPKNYFLCIYKFLLSLISFVISLTGGCWSSLAASR